MKTCGHFWLLVVLVASAAATGCSPTSEEFVTPERLDHGLVIILPGIEGEGPLSYNIRTGLLRGGVASALPIYRWGRPIPLAGPMLNQMDVLGNRLVSGQIAQFIANYQDSHPDMPVYLIGHSGGGGIAVFTAEELSKKERKVEGLVLLSASISKTYDLTKALACCRNGIVNFYSRHDVGLLGVGTTIFGNVDGIRGPSAGLAGFDKTPAGLYQVPWSEKMSSTGNLGGHMDSAEPGFVAKYVAPWVMAASWPMFR